MTDAKLKALEKLEDMMGAARLRKVKPSLTITIGGIGEEEVEEAEKESGLDLDRDEGEGEDSGEKPYSEQTDDEKRRGEEIIARLKRLGKR